MYTNFVLMEKILHILIIIISPVYPAVLVLYPTACGLYSIQIIKND